MKTFSTITASMLAMAALVNGATLINGDFETGVADFVQWPGYVAGTGAMGTNPAEIPGWTGDGGRGINPVVPGAAGDSPFDDPNTWNTTHSAFLQGASYIEQTVTGFSVGADYLLDIDFNARGCCGDNPIATISLNGSVLAGSADLFGGDGVIPSLDGDQPWHHASIPFTAPTEDIVLRIASQAATGGDASLVVDNVQVAPIPEPTGAAFLLRSGATLMLRRSRKKS